MITDELVRSLNRHDWDALAEIRTDLINEPDSYRKLIQELLASEQLRDDITIAVELMTLLVEHSVREDVETWVLDTWADMGHVERRRVIAAFHDPQLLGTSVAEDLFYSASSGVAERHSILAALAVSARPRQCEQLVVELTPKVGRYEDSTRQAGLEAFAHMVRSSLGTDSGRDG